jgi:hypothetical protein
MSTIGAPTYHLPKLLVGLLGSHTGNSSHHTKNSTDTVCTFGSLRAGPQDIMANFNVVSLFTRVLIRETISLLSRHFEKNILRLFFHALTSYVSFTGQFYE